MAQAMREATEATRDRDDAIITITNHHVQITFDGSIPFVVDTLIRRKDWMVDPSTEKSDGLTIFKS